MSDPEIETASSGEAFAPPTPSIGRPDPPQASKKQKADVTKLFLKFGTTGADMARLVLDQPPESREAVIQYIKQLDRRKHAQMMEELGHPVPEPGYLDKVFDKNDGYGNLSGRDHLRIDIMKL